MKASAIDFRTMLEFRPEEGRVLLGKDRLLIFREESFAILRRLLIEQLGERLSRAHLAQFGYHCGTSDHKTLKKNYTWDSDLDEMASGPAMHMWEGIARVAIPEQSFDRASGAFHMRVIWTNSYEAAAHLSTIGRSDVPVCYTLTGYASGWCSAFMGKPIVAIEERCGAKGDDACVALIRSADAWGPEADPWKEALAADLSVARQMEKAALELAAYQRALAAVNTPVIQVLEDVVVVPVIGIIDERRTSEMMDTVLQRVAADGVRCVIFDVTGVETRAASMLEGLLRIADAARLLGASVILTGIRPEMAQALVHAGFDASRLSTCRTLREALDLSFRELGYQVTRVASR